MSEEEKLNAIKEIKEDSKVLEFVANVMQEKEDLQQEIERLNKELEKYKYSADELNEIERLHSIIKEVREWANKTVFYFDFEEEINKHAFDLLYTKQGQELLEILDKGFDKE